MIEVSKSMKQLDSIIGMIYDAALNPQEWESLLAAIASAVGAVAGLYAGLDNRHGRGAYWHSAGYDLKTQLLYNEHYLSIDPTLAHIIQTPGKAFACSEYMTDASVASSRFHSEFMIPNGIRYVLSGVVSMAGSMVSFFGFQRHISQPPFSQVEVDFVQRLIPHFAKADQVAAKVSAMSESKRLAITVLDRLDYGIIIVNERGQVRMTNQRAEQWLQSGDVIRSTFGQIRLTNAKDDIVFGGLIKSAAEASDTDMQAKTFETLARDSNGRVRIAVVPISEDEKRQLDDSEASVVLVLSEVNQQPAMTSHVLQNSYGLTVAETKVANGLAGGQTQDELSAALFVSLATIKTHTQHIYQKIGVSRQVDLVRLVFGLSTLP